MAGPPGPVAKALRLHADRAPHLSRQAVARLRGLAVDTRFERQEKGGGLIDGDHRRAVVSHCTHCGWTAGELARRLGVRDGTVTAWWDGG